MIRPGAIVMTVLMTAVAVGVYFGLDYIPKDLVPGTKKTDEAASAAPAPVQPAAAPDAGTEAPPDPFATAGVTEEDLAEEPPPAATMSGSGAPSLSGAVDADPPADAAFDSEEQVADAPAAEPPAEPDTPASAAAAPESQAEAPAKSAPAQVASARSAATDKPREPVKPKAPEADAIKQWWPDPASMSANQLKLQYAGPVQNEQAIGLLFSAPLNLDSLKKNAEVRNAVGDAVGAGWELGNNPRMAVLRGVKPGRYTVILDPAVADTSGYMLGLSLQGPVYIQAGK